MECLSRCLLRPFCEGQTLQQGMEMGARRAMALPPLIALAPSSGQPTGNGSKTHPCLYLPAELAGPSRRALVHAPCSLAGEPGAHPSKVSAQHPGGLGLPQCSQVLCHLFQNVRGRKGDLPVSDWQRYPHWEEPSSQLLGVPH